MLVTRFGALWQPAWARTALLFSEAGSAVGSRLQPAFETAAKITEQATNLVAAFLTPAAVVCGVLGLWRLTSDLGWTASFAISNGVFSHWQVWIMMAIGMKMTGSMITRASAEERDNDS